MDAIALGTWAATGAQKTLAVGLGWLPAILLGTITAVGGGLVRDVVLGRVPGILGGNTLYATCAIAASAIMVLFQRAGLSPAPGLVGGDHGRRRAVPDRAMAGLDPAGRRCLVGRAVAIPANPTASSRSAQEQ